MSEFTVYKSDPSTGQVFETMEAESPEHKEELIKKGWYETPRWQRNPRPNGLTNDNPYERTVVTPFQEFPRWMHRAGKTRIAHTELEKQEALAAGWTISPEVATAPPPVSESAEAAVSHGASVAKRGRPRKADAA